MTLKKKSHLSTVWAWLLCPYIQFTGFLVSVVQFNTHTTLYILECYVPSLKLGSDILHIVNALTILLAYSCISYAVHKRVPPRYCVASGCASVAVACLLMGSSVFTSHPLRPLTVADTRGNLSVEENASNSSICDTYKPFRGVQTEASAIPWDLPLLTALLAQTLVMYGVAVHFVAGLLLVDSGSLGLRSPVVLAFLLVAQNSAPYIGSFFSPMVNRDALDDSLVSGWTSLWTEGWAPLGAALLFLTPFAVLLASSESGLLSRHVTSSDTVCDSAGTDDDAEEKEMDDIVEEDSEQCDKDFLQSTTRVLSSPIFLCNLLSQVFISAALTGVEEIQNTLATLLRSIGNSADTDASVRDFLVKYSAHVNNYGPAVTLCLTGWVIYKTRPAPRRLVVWTALTLLWMAVFVLMFARDAGQGNFKFSLNSTPDECACETLLKEAPTSAVCSAEKALYPSPCYAGCTRVCSGPNRTQYFTDCSSLSTSSSLSRDECVSDTGWDRLVWFLFIFIAVKSLVSSGRLIGVFISLRCVSEQESPLSLAATTGLTVLVEMLDRTNFYAQHITELTCLALLSTAPLLWFLARPLPLYSPPGAPPQSLHTSRSRKNKGPSVNAGAADGSSRHENSTLLPPRPSISDSIVDETELLDVKIMSRQRDSIDVTRSKRLLRSSAGGGKRFSLDYKKRRSMPDFEEHVVYP